MNMLPEEQDARQLSLRFQVRRSPFVQASPLLRPPSRASASARSEAAMSSISCQAPSRSGMATAAPEGCGYHRVCRGSGVRVSAGSPLRAEAFSHRDGARAVGSAQHDPELARPAVAGEHIAGSANQRLQRIGDALEAGITLGFSLPFVEGSEVIDLDHQDRHELTVP